MSIGTNIKRVRKQKGLTQEELAQKLGLSVMTVRRFETDAREPKYNMLVNIADALDTSVHVIIGTPLTPQLITETPEGIQTKEMTVEDAQAFLNERELLAAFNQLNDDGQKVAVERVEELADIPKYKK